MQFELLEIDRGIVYYQGFYQFSNTLCVFEYFSLVIVRLLDLVRIFTFKETAHLQRVTPAELQISRKVEEQAEKARLADFPSPGPRLPPLSLAKRQQGAKLSVIA